MDEWHESAGRATLFRALVLLAACPVAAAAASLDWEALEQAPTPLAALGQATSWQSTDPAARNRLVQEIARLHAEAGETASALAAYPFGPSGTAPSPVAGSVDALGADFHCQPALPALVERAAASRFVFVNEAHHVPQTRALTFALLRELRGRGFTHFALEALHEPGAVLAARGYPARGSGTYLQEPVFGELVREALRLGYRLVEYEDRGDGDMEAREATQARQLLERTRGVDPDARVLVHAGYAHVDLAVGRLWNVLPLAGRVATRFPGEVLSIDQVDLRHDPKGREHPLYRPLLAAFPAREPLACVRGGSPWAVRADRNTVSIVLPDPGPDERPAWLDLGGARRAIAAPALCGESLPCLVEAWDADEGPDAVPADRCVQRTTDARCRLYLRPGDYRLRGSDATGGPRSQAAARIGG